MTATRACIRTDENARTLIARQSEAFTLEISTPLSSLSHHQRQNQRLAQRTWNLLLEYLASSASARPAPSSAAAASSSSSSAAAAAAASAAAASATSAESLIKLKVRETREPRSSPEGQKEKGVAGAAAAAAAAEEMEEDEEDALALGEEEALPPGFKKSISPALRHAFVEWLGRTRKVSQQSAHGYCTSVDQIVMQVMQLKESGDAAAVEVLQDARDGERFVRCVVARVGLIDVMHACSQPAFS